MHPLSGRPSRSSVVRAVTAVAALGAALVAACRAPLDIKKFQGNPDRLYAASYQAFQHHHWDDAVSGFEKLTLDLAAHDTLLSRSYFYLGEAHERKSEPLLAAQAFSRLADAFPDDSLAAPALFRAGRAYEHLWRRPDLDDTYGQSALAEFQTLLALYPTSPLKDGADQQAAHLQEWFAEKDYLNGLYYYHRKAYDSAIIYLKNVIKNYPNVPITREAYLRLVDSYHKIRYKEDADDICNTLRITYPQDPEVQHRCVTTPTNTAQHP